MSTISIKTIKKIINETSIEHDLFLAKAETGERYYKSKNDILEAELPQDDAESPRNSNRRIPSSLYHLLVEQKWSFMFKNGIKFRSHYKEKETAYEDIVHYDNPEHKHNEKSKAKELDKKIREKLGNEFAAEARSLCINASNTGRAWLHYWKTGSHLGDEEDKGVFKYASINPKEIHAEWGNTADRELLWVLRHYDYRDPTDGEKYEVYEYWDKEYCYCYRKKKENTLRRGLKEYPRFYYFSTEINDYKETHIYKHGFDRVPFICFRNNEFEITDLEPIKDLIDAYDLVNSQFVNDEEDFQKMIFILTGYGDEPSDEFLQNLKRKKLVKIESSYPEKALEPKLETLAIEIPTDAYQTSLDLNKRAIYEQGMGMDVTDDDINYTSEAALDFKYSLLELKCAATKIQFEKGFTILIKEVAKDLGYKDIDETLIETVWNDGKVRNMTDAVNNARLCLGFTSLRTALENNPLVRDVDEEIKRIEMEKQEEMKRDEMQQGFGMGSTNSVYYNRYYGSNNRQSEYQINRSQSEIKAKQPERFTQSKKVTNSTEVKK